MNFFILNMKIHVSCGITGRKKSSRIKLIARIIFFQGRQTSSASERDDVNTPLHKTAFDLEATQRRALNAIVTQTSAELPTQCSDHQYAAKRRVTAQDARAPQGSRNNDEREVTR